MKKWIDNGKNIFHSTRGETILEGVVSLLLLSALILAVTMMVQSSFKMTSMFTQQSRQLQEDIINPIILSNEESGSNYSEYEETNINISYELDGKTKTAIHKVEFNTADGIIAFAPEKKASTGGE